MREDNACRTDSSGARMCDAVGQCSVPHLVKDVNPLLYSSGSGSNTYPSLPMGFTQGPDRRVYFSANDGSSGEELWVTDGTSSGTMLVADILPGLGNSSPRGLVNATSRLFFSAVDASGYAKLFATNGTTVGTTLVKDLGNTGFMYNNFNGRAAGNVVYFSGCSSANGCELWRSDGTNAGTYMVSDIMTTLMPSSTQSFGSNPSELAVMSNVVYFRAASAVVGLGSTNTLADAELWRSDGTATNTVRVADLSPGVSNSWPTNLTVLQSFVGPRLLFAASQGTTNQELYVTDGSLGNVASYDLNPGDGSSSPGPFVTMGNRAYFTAIGPASGRELWVTDGTRTGTYLVKDINLGVADGNPSLLTAGIGNFLYFQANDGTAGTQLYRSDGTANGTTKVFSSFVPTGAALFSMAPVANWMFIATAGGIGAQELWVTNGTSAGTFRSCPDPSGACGQFFPNNASELKSIDGRMYFNATGTRYLGGSIGAEPFVYP
jgi:ELWxxDGT repeat protein